MKVPMKMNHMGHIEIWKNEENKDAGKEADLYLQTEADIQAMIEEIGPDSTREITNGWTILDQEIDDMWFGDNQ